MKTIQELVSDFYEVHQNQYTNSERSDIIKKFIDQFGYDLVSQATGYKQSTLVQIKSDKSNRIPVSDVKARQAVYVFSNYNPE